MNRHSAWRLINIGLVLGCLTFVFLAWYAYLALKRGSISNIVMASLVFGSGAIVGAVSFLVPSTDQGGYVLDPRRLTSSQNVTVAIAALILAVCSVWLVVSREIGTFISVTVRGPVASGVLKSAIVLSGLYFAWHAWVRFNHAFRQPRQPPR